MKTILVTIACVFTACWMIWLVGRAIDQEFQTQRPAVCTEDMSCWDCKTMGNEICGTP